MEGAMHLRIRQNLTTGIAQVLDVDRKDAAGEPVVVAVVFDADAAAVLAHVAELHAVCRELLGPRVWRGATGAAVPFKLYKDLADTMRRADPTCRVRVV